MLYLSGISGLSVYSMIDLSQTFMLNTNLYAFVEVVMNDCTVPEFYISASVISIHKVWPTRTRDFVNLGLVLKSGAAPQIAVYDVPKYWTASENICTLLNFII